MSEDHTADSKCRTRLIKLGLFILTLRGSDLQISSWFDDVLAGPERVLQELWFIHLGVLANLILKLVLCLWHEGRLDSSCLGKLDLFC